MKKIILFILVCSLILISAMPVKGVVDSSPSAAKNNQELDKIRQLKEKVAEKVAKLKVGSEKIYQGKVMENNEGLITLIDENNNQLKIQTNSQTSFIWLNTDAKKLTISLKDIVKNDYVTAWGEVNQETNLLTARVISGRLPLFFFTCLVSETNTITNVLSCQNKVKAKTFDLTIDEKTNISLYQTNGKVITYDWKKIPANSLIVVKAIDKNQPNDLLTALSIINFPSSN